MFSGSQDGGSGGGVGTVGIEQQGNAHWAEKGFFGGGEQFFARRDIGAADENRRLRQVLRGTGEDRAMDQVADVAGLDVGVLQQAIDARIGGDNRIENAGVRIGVELDEDFGEGHFGVRNAECGMRNQRQMRANILTDCLFRVVVWRVHR